MSVGIFVANLRPINNEDWVISTGSSRTGSSWTDTLG